MLLMLRKNSDDVFYSRDRTPPRKRAQSEKERKKKPKPEQRKRSPLSASLEVVEKRKRCARKLSEALRSPKEMLMRKKKLGPSLSWEPEPSCEAKPSEVRSRIHSDGSESGDGEQRSGKRDGIEGPRFELEVSCGHCSLVAEHRSKLLRTEIESAVKLLARRLGSSRAGRTPLLGMPNIVVSSISSDEEDVLTERQTSSDRGSLQTSETR
ncbi:unnamed protein product [Heligmosomoides polygyrus]|uniref:Protein ENL n=1 Tax=Heligmosomoides polygyrus TaxID=6339 RepID=A0A183FE96_HELPZ|nr:unnamed protein product [Heligmosomoides polygyrus]